MKYFTKTSGSSDPSVRLAGQKGLCEAEVKLAASKPHDGEYPGNAEATCSSLIAAGESLPTDAATRLCLLEFDASFPRNEVPDFRHLDGPYESFGRLRGYGYAGDMKRANTILDGFACDQAGSATKTKLQNQLREELERTIRRVNRQIENLARRPSEESFRREVTDAGFQFSTDSNYSSFLEIVKLYKAFPDASPEILQQTNDTLAALVVRLASSDDPCSPWRPRLVEAKWPYLYNWKITDNSLDECRNYIRHEEPSARVKVPSPVVGFEWTGLSTALGTLVEMTGKVTGYNENYVELNHLVECHSIFGAIDSYHLAWEHQTLDPDFRRSLTNQIVTVKGRLVTPPQRHYRGFTTQSLYPCIIMRMDGAMH